MEAILQDVDWNSASQHPTDAAVALPQALRALAQALQAALPLLSDADVSTEAVAAPPPSNAKTAKWLYDQLNNIPSELGSDFLVRQVWEASRLADEARQQATLFDVLGASEQAMQIMFSEIAPNLGQIAQIPEAHLGDGSTAGASQQAGGETLVDMEEERRRFLVSEAQEAAQMAALAQAQVDAIQGGGGAGTHTVVRASDRKAAKWAEKAKKRAAVALQRAKDAGAMVDEQDLLQINTADPGMGGLVGQTSEEMLFALQSALLPEGARHHYDKRGLPPDTIIESTEDYEKAIIPPAVRDLATLPTRLLLKDILSPVERVAFTGTNSLNPMQSAVFQRAFHSRNNLLVCAPTGAGKTNVALLTVVAHFRDVGLLPKDRNDQEQGKEEPRRVETGRKVIYIAPMKALAQEVVEKFSAKLKPLRLIVRELTGDMQLSRAEAEAANVIVTVSLVFQNLLYSLRHCSCSCLLS
jgi:Rad3-related DNA helicase